MTSFLSATNDILACRTYTEAVHKRFLRLMAAEAMEVELLGGAYNWFRVRSHDACLLLGGSLGSEINLAIHISSVLV